MYLGDKAWPDLGEYVGSESVAIVPVGSTEQHGPHLPLATDHLIAEALAREAADRTEYLCTPTINIGVSPHHRQFHGTAWVDAPAFRQYMKSLTRNLTYHGLNRVVYVNAHGGNVQHLREVGRQLHDDGVAFAIEWMWDESIPELVNEVFETNGPHAGPKETAMIMHIAGELVHDDRLEAARDGGLTQMENGDYIQNGARVFYDAIENSPNGAFGDQTDATPEIGEQLFEAASDQLVSLLQWLNERESEELAPRARVDPNPDLSR